MSEQSFSIDMTSIAPLNKRIKAGVFDYLIPLIMIISGVILTSTAFDEFSLIAGIIVEALGGFLVFVNQLGPKNLPGITNGKKLAKIRIMELIDADKLIVRPISKMEKGKMVTRAIVAFIGVLFFLFYALISLILMSSSSLKRSLADRLTGTVVINFDEQAPPAGLSSTTSVDQETATYRPLSTSTRQTSAQIFSTASNMKLAHGLVLGGLVGLIITHIYQIIRMIYIIAYEALFVFADYNILLPNLLNVLRTLFNIFIILSLLSFLTGFLLSIPGIEPTLKTPFFLVLGTFLCYTLLVLVDLFVNFSTGGFLLSRLMGYYTYSLGINIADLVMEGIELLLLVVGLSFLTNLFKRAEPIYNTPRQRFIGSIFFLIFYFALHIAGVIVCAFVLRPWTLGNIISGIAYFSFRVLYLVKNFIMIGVYSAIHRKYRRFSKAIQQSKMS